MIKKGGKERSLSYSMRGFEYILVVFDIIYSIIYSKVMLYSDTYGSVAERSKALV